MKSITSKPIWLIILMSLTLLFSSNRAGYTSPDGYTNVKLPFPAGVSNPVSTSHDGDDRHAIDFAMPVDRTIVAIRDGYISQAGKQDYAGNYIIINHGDGYCSHYYHLKEKILTSGSVRQGQTIGKSGNTGCGPGNTCKNHLHIAVSSICNHTLDANDAREVAIIFDEVGRELTNDDNIVSQNSFSPSVSFDFANGIPVTTNGQVLPPSNNPNWQFSGTASNDTQHVKYISWGSNGDANELANGVTSWNYQVNNLVGHNRVHFVAYNSSGTRSSDADKHYIDLYVDVNPPKTTPVVNDDPEINNWYTSDAQVTLTTEDEGSGGSGSDINNILHSYVAGVQTIRYRINEGSWQTYIGSQVSFLVSGDGEHVVQYYAIDKVGNQEAINSLTIKIDSIPPTAPTDIVEIHGAVSGQWQNSWSDPEFNWSAATDDASGIQYYRFNWAGEQFFPTNTNFAPLPVRTGSYTLTIRAVDNANNVGPASTPFYFNYDGTAPPPPEIFHTAGIASGIWQNEIRTADFYWPTPNDEGSGVNGYYLYWGSDENGTSPTLITDNEFVNDTPITTPDNAITYYLRLKSEDNVGQPSPWISYTLRYDGAIPVGTLVANYGQPVVPQTRVHLDINGSDLGSGVAKMRLSTEGYIWSEWRELEDEIFWEIPNVGRRSYDIYLQLLDGANNLSEPISDTIYLDTNIPYPRSDNFQLWNNLVSGGSAEGMQTTNFQMDATVGQGYDAPYLLSSGYILQPGYRAAILGTPTEVPTTTGKILLGSVVSAGGTDAAALNSPQYRMYGTLGQPSDTQTVTSTHFVATLGFWGGAGNDVTLQPPPPPPPPTPQPCEFYSISINNGALFTNDPNVSLNLCGPGANWMMLSNDGGFTGASWQNFTSTVNGWTLTTYGATILPRYVYARYQDAAGQIYGNFFDDIIYDPTPPSGAAAFDPRQLLGGGQRNSMLAPMFTVNQTQAELFLSVSDDSSGLDEMQVSFSPDFDGAVWQDYTGIVPVTFTEDGVQTVYTRFRDQAGNISSAISADLMVDTTGPTGSATASKPIVGYGDIAVPVSLSAQDATSGMAYVRASYSPSFTDTTWITYTGSIALPVAADDLNPTVYVQYRDRAGNESSIVETSYQIDDTWPDGGIEVTGWQGTIATLTLSVTDDLSAVTEVWISPDYWFLENVTVVPYAATLEWDFGEYGEMFFIFKDAADNYSYPFWVPGASGSVYPTGDSIIYLPLIVK